MGEKRGVDAAFGARIVLSVCWVIFATVGVVGVTNELCTSFASYSTV